MTGTGMRPRRFDQQSPAVHARRTAGLDYGAL